MAATVSLTTVQRVIARALAEGRHDRGRIERAAALIAMGAVEKHDEKLYSVASQTENGKRYAVTPDGCSCFDKARNPNLRCKHELSVRIILSAEIHERKERESELAAQFTEAERAGLVRLRERRERAGV